MTAKTGDASMSGCGAGSGVAGSVAVRLATQQSGCVSVSVVSPSCARSRASAEFGQHEVAITTCITGQKKYFRPPPRRAARRMTAISRAPARATNPRAMSCRRKRRPFTNPPYGGASRTASGALSSFPPWPSGWFRRRRVGVEFTLGGPGNRPARAGRTWEVRVTLLSRWPDLQDLPIARVDESHAAET